MSLERRHPPALRFCDLLIIDEILPLDFSPFRTLEYTHYLTYFGSSLLLSTEGWHGWAANESFDQLLARSELPNAVKSRLVHCSTFDHIVPRLAYITFLNNAWQIFEQLQERKIPFILQLYPGGGFEQNSPDSDMKLRALCASPLCRKIVVTQNLSRAYLLEKIGCQASKIEFIYGGVYDTRNDFDFMRDKRRYGEHKESIDICFVAHRYGDDVRKKGYDQFLAIAAALAPRHAHLNFHVVGDYTPDQLPLGEAAGRITFHGKRPNSFFREFYPSMDLIVSVNRSADGDTGAFDGFPTGACMEAGFRGVLNCASDPLRMNVAFEDDVNIVLLDFDLDRSVARIAALIDDPARMYRLAHANWAKFVEVFDTDRQLWARCRIITNELLAEETLVLRPSPSISVMDGTLVALRNTNHRLKDELASVRREKDALSGEVRAKTDSVLDLQRRHDNLLHEYRKLETGFAELDADRAHSLAVARENFNELANVHAAFTDDSAWTPGERIGRLELRFLRMFRSRIWKAMRRRVSFLVRKLRNP